MLNYYSFNLKKVFAIIAVASFMFAAVAPLANAQASVCRVRADVTAAEVVDITGNPARGAVTAGASLPLTGTQAGENALICGFALIKWIANVVFAVLIAIAVLMIAYASYLFVMSGSNPANMKKAKQVMLFAIIGLIVASIAKLIPNIASTILGFT